MIFFIFKFRGSFSFLVLQTSLFDSALLWFAAGTSCRSGCWWRRPSGQGLLFLAPWLWPAGCRGGRGWWRSRPVPPRVDAAHRQLAALGCRGSAVRASADVRVELTTLGFVTEWTALVFEDPPAGRILRPFLLGWLKSHWWGGALVAGVLGAGLGPGERGGRVTESVTLVLARPTLPLSLSAENEFLFFQDGRSSQRWGLGRGSGASSASRKLLPGSLGRQPLHPSSRGGLGAAFCVRKCAPHLWLSRPPPVGPVL